MSPVGPGACFVETAPQGFAYAGPVNVAKHVHKVKVGYHHRFQGAVSYDGSHGGTLMLQRLSGTWQVGTPLVHVQGDKSETVLHETRRLAYADRRNSPILTGLGVPFFFALPSEACASEPAILRRSLMCSAGVPVGPRAVRAAYRRLARVAIKPIAWVAHLRLVVRRDVNARAEARVGNFSLLHTTLIEL